MYDWVIQVPERQRGAFFMSNADAHSEVNVAFLIVNLSSG